MGQSESLTVPAATETTPRVTGVLKDMGLIYGGSETAMQRGRAVHTGIALLATGKLDWSSVSDEILPYLMAYEQFVDHSKFSVSCVETPVYHRLYDFKGTPDLVGSMGDETWIVEVKTGAKEPWHELQTGAYQLLLERPESKRFIRRVGLYLSINGTYSLSPHGNYYDSQIFLSFLTAWRWKYGNGYIKRLEAAGNGVATQAGVSTNPR